MTRLLTVGVFFAAMLAVGACGGLEDEKGADQKAEELVSKVHAAGLAPRLTTADAAALYGNEAPTICTRLTSSYRAGILNSLDTGPTTRAPGEVAEETVKYARIVVSVYCPDKESDFENLVKEWDFAV